MNRSTSWFTHIPAAGNRSRQRHRRLEVEALEDRVVPSTITWVNRGNALSDSDNFASVFGAQAETARRVVDAAINAWERVITDFNYAFSFSNNFDLTVRMAFGGTGFGATASTDSVWFGKPTASTITISRGNDTGVDGIGDGAGWFLDPTPTEHSEFLGNIVNAFAGDAQAGSPAFGLRDLYSVVVVEMTHSMGITSHPDVAFQTGGFTTLTGITDDSEGSGVGRYFVFNGPSITHLMTSNNGGGNGSDFGVAVHSAGVGGQNQPVNFAGQQYLGAEDTGNAIYEPGRRYLIPNTMRLMLEDAYGYDTVNPITFGTFYSALNRATGELLVRGGAGTSADTITIDHFDPGAGGQRLRVSVDIGNDVPGTGPFSGAQNLPAFVTTYTLDQVDSIRIVTGDGGDTIRIDQFAAGMPVNIDAGLGNDLILLGNGDLDSNTNGSITLDGGEGNDELRLDDSGDDGTDAYSISSTRFDKTSFRLLTYDGLETIRLDANNQNNVITIASLGPTTALTVNGNGGIDTFNVGNRDFDSNIRGVLFANGGTGENVLNIDDFDDAGNDTYNLTNVAFRKVVAGSGILVYDSISSIVLNGSSANGTFDVNSLSAGTSLRIVGRGVTDTFNIGGGDFDTNLLGSVDLVGGPGGAILHIRDTSDNTGADSYLITETSFSKPSFGSGSVTYSEVGSFILDASNQSNTIRVEGLHFSLDLLTVNGNGGADTFVIGAGDTPFSLSSPIQVNGGAGEDTIRVDSRIVLSGRNYVITNDSITGVGLEAITFNSIGFLELNGNDNDETVSIQTTGLLVTVFGNGGDDLLQGGASNDVLHGGPGMDTINGGGGNDHLFGDGDRDSLDGGSGEDTIEGGSGNDSIKGGPGNDSMVGDDGDDKFSGGFGFDVAVGGEGNDSADKTVESFDGGPGEDGIVFTGTRGNDDIRVWWSEGPQMMIEHNGTITAIDYAAGETITVFAGEGNDRVKLEESGGMRWRAEFHGENGNDHLVGSVNNDRLFGGNGRDFLDGGDGDDILVGGNGRDLLLGGNGQDLLIGGRGRDLLHGGQDEDLLIGSFTDFDDDVEALAGIMSEWTSGGTYEERVNHLRTGIDVNGETITLDESTVHNDGARDILSGGEDRDWFFVALGKKGKMKDRITTLEEDEFVDPVGK